MEFRKGISGSTLKLIAIVTMLIDHTAAVILERVIYARGFGTAGFFTAAENQQLYNIYMIMRSIGRLAFPIFCFLLVEGFLNTRSVRKYACRLAAFALISEIPFDIALTGTPFYFDYQNIYFTLLIGLLVLLGFKLIYEKAADKKLLFASAVIGAIGTGCAAANTVMGIMKKQISFKDGFSGDTGVSILFMGLVIAAVFSTTAILLYFIAGRKRSFQKANIIFTQLLVLIVGMIAAEVLKTDYSGFGVLTIAVMYWLRVSHLYAMLGGCITLTIMSSGEYPAFLALIPIWLYNGKRGLKMKYLFYAFYPVHLLILYLICYFTGIV